MKLVCAFVFVAFLAGATAETNGSVVTESTLISSLPASAFVYNPIATNTIMASAGGQSTPRQLTQWSTLNGYGISQTDFVMNGCAIRPPHVHLKASGLLYVIQARNMSVGFVTEAGQAVVNYIQTGASALFPQGLQHYQQNNDCNPAYYTISYGNEDPGTQVVAPALETLPASVAASALGLNATAYAALKAGLPTPAFVPNSDPDCVARCSAAGVSLTAPAPSVLPTISAAGR